MGRVESDKQTLSLWCGNHNGKNRMERGGRVAGPQGNKTVVEGLW